MSERKPTCPVCGGHEFYETSSVYLKQKVERWVAGYPDEYDEGRILWDTIESLQRPYDCADCGAIELSHCDLFPEE